MRDPQISIIIPAYNEEEALPVLIYEIRERSRGFAHEIIVADGGSTDRTIEAAEESGARVIRCRERGRAAQMNEGADAASGTHFYFLHADTIPPNRFDEIISNSIQQGFPAGSFRLTFDDPHPVLSGYAWFTRFPLLLFRYGDQSLYTERTLFEQVGGFDKQLIVMEDQEMVRDLWAKAPFALMEESVETSARKYRENGVFRLQVIFTLIVMLYYAGAGQKLLVHFYNQMIRNDFR
ncbi:MAG: glycosyltransferase [Bacteroidetes bacterium]|jgi:rSAM/selenodomain-associated transferase 2|nr:glycosyltransferase [Bacteroidota bacterium]